MLRQAIDDWRRRQPDQPSRMEAIRLLLERGLDEDAKQDPPADAPDPGDGPAR